MSSLAEIKAAAAKLPLDQQEDLYRALKAQLHPDSVLAARARLVRRGNDALLEAAPGTPVMTPASVKRMLEDWP